MAESGGVRDRRGPGSGIGRALAAAAALAVVLLPFRGLEAQSMDRPALELRRDLPLRSMAGPCPDGRAVSRMTSPREREEAAALAREATQAMILGDAERARSFLSGAAALDPTSTSIQLQLGRVLEELGNREGAFEAYCLALALTPSESGRAEADEAIRRLGSAREGPPVEAARAAFLAGVERFDASEYEEAELHFSRALAERPDWAAAHYNRGVTRLRLNRPEAGHRDLVRYLELSPDAEEAASVRARLGARSDPPVRNASRRSPAAAMALGLVIPGMGQFYAGRPWTGVMYLLGAGGSAAAAFLYTEVEVLCVLEEPSGDCPPESIAGEVESRPFRKAGVVSAAAITLIGAAHALISTRRQGGRPPTGSDLSALRWTPPVHGFPEVEVALALSPVMRRHGAGLQATLQLRF